MGYSGVHAEGSGPLAGGVTGTAFLSSISTLPPEERVVSATNLSKLAEEYSSSVTGGLRKQMDLQKELLFNEHEADIQYNFGATGVNSHAGQATATLFEHNDPGDYSGIVTSLLMHSPVKRSIFKVQTLKSHQSLI